MRLVQKINLQHEWQIEKEGGLGFALNPARQKKKKKKNQENRTGQYTNLISHQDYEPLDPSWDSHKV